jgi:hypothetical protein
MPNKRRLWVGRLEGIELSAPWLKFAKYLKRRDRHLVVKVLVRPTGLGQLAATQPILPIYQLPRHRYPISDS